MKALISNSGVGRNGKLIEFSDLDDLATKIDSRSAFARVSYTNNDWHPRCHTWYPVLGLLEGGIKSDWQFEAEWAEGWRRKEVPSASIS